MDGGAVGRERALLPVLGNSAACPRSHALLGMRCLPTSASPRKDLRLSAACGVRGGRGKLGEARNVCRYYDLTSLLSPFTTLTACPAPAAPSSRAIAADDTPTQYDLPRAPGPAVRVLSRAIAAADTPTHYDLTRAFGLALRALQRWLRAFCGGRYSDPIRPRLCLWTGSVCPAASVTNFFTPAGSPSFRPGPAAPSSRAMAAHASATNFFAPHGSPSFRPGPAAPSSRAMAAHGALHLPQRFGAARLLARAPPRRLPPFFAPRGSPSFCPGPAAPSSRAMAAHGALDLPQRFGAARLFARAPQRRLPPFFAPHGSPSFRPGPAAPSSRAMSAHGVPHPYYYVSSSTSALGVL
ncbi:hypothetical protein DFH06DRAFT_1351018 [Mycena polygramma]|nr:hypothetical protein DFH06DRAFT_1351018 [Mycena polygramma]